MKFKAILFVLILIPSMVFAQGGATLKARPIIYEGSIESELGAEKNFERMEKAFSNSFGKFSQTKVEFKSEAADSLFATSRINFVQDMLLNRDATRGPITFKIGLKANDDVVHYKLYDIVHHGNTELRVGPANFGLLTDALEPPKIVGTTKKSRVVSWQEMKDSTDVNLKNRVLEFEKQMGLPL